VTWSFPAADRIPVGVDKIVEMMADPVAGVRGAALVALRPYVGLGNADVDNAVKAALDDPKHKNRHWAAGVLGVACPGCGKGPQKGESQQDPEGRE
jgi:hypothetical protein